MNTQRLTIMAEIAIMAALAYVLGMIKIFQMPQGGSISLIMLPIVIVALRRGLAAGLLTGLIVGELDHLIGGYVVHPIQFILDYPLAYTSIGLVGLARSANWLSGANQTVKIWLSLLMAVTVRFLCHFTSGVVWFGSYAPEGMSAAVYSFLYNLSYILPEYIITGIVLTLLVKKAPQLAHLSR
ncbi:energy-coupled thiamine transporter ThiT [Brevibacillus massiliensis]|jgi:thiamine transporter|uniref:energy-coupled thiamine transporter ThiT n=1 Tax=Brevibacillus massiliensis TaxID=1118054 RepID=UPI0002E652D3|nr:energy-coupled thiamine transporter ThiT [Brevibacillus massiliensis]